MREEKITVDELILTRTALEELHTRWPLLNEIQAAAYEPGSSGRADLTGIRNTNTDAGTMQALIKLEAIHSIRLNIELLAHEWGWQPGDPTHTAYLIARWPWARDHMPADTPRRIHAIHARFQTLVKEAPLNADRVCPSCGTSRLRETHEGNYHCAQCELTRTPAEIEALTLYRLTHEDTQATPTEAAEILNIPAQTIYSWIRRGHLTKHDGRIPLADAHRLAAREPATCD